MVMLTVGKEYLVKHTSGMIHGRYLGSIQRGWGQHTHYLFINLKTGRQVEVKSGGRIKKELD